MASKVISTGNSNATHISRIIKAAQALNLEDYSTKPSGVWGSTATIECNGVTINSAELDFEITVPFDDNLESNEGEIIVYNLSDNTLNQLVVGKTLTIEAGYEGDTGVIFSGEVRKVDTKRDGADRATTIRVIDGVTTSTAKLIEDGKIADSYDGVPAKDILWALLEAEGSPIATSKDDIKSDYTYENSVSIGDDLQAEIKKFSEVCGVSTFKVNGKIYCCKLEDVSNDVAFDASEETGMIGSPSPFEKVVKVGDTEETIKGFKIEMLLQHRAAVGAIVNLKSEQYTGKYYIQQGTHRFNQNEATTSIEVVEK